MDFFFCGGVVVGFASVSLELGMQTVARALAQGSGRVRVESGYSSAGWVWPQPTLCWVVPLGGTDKSLRLPRHFLPLRSNVVTLSSRNVIRRWVLTLCLQELWAVFPQVL